MSRGAKDIAIAKQAATQPLFCRNYEYAGHGRQQEY